MKNNTRLQPIPALNEEQMEGLEKALEDMESAEEIARLLHDELSVDEDHLKFLTNLPVGGEHKLREFYYEVIKFDLMNGTNTSSFIPEDLYKQIAEERPQDLANPEQARHGVKHRSSLTHTIVNAFNGAVRVLRDHGIDPKQASLFDLGCGEGKAVIIGASNDEDYKFPFKKAVGIDYFQDVLDVARKNAESESLAISGTRPASFEFADAAEFKGFNGVNVVYMYNPFDETVMEKVEKNLRKYGGKTIVIYNKPLHRELFENQGWHREDENSSEDPDKETVIFSWGLKQQNGTTAPTNNGSDTKKEQAPVREL